MNHRAELLDAEVERKLASMWPVESERALARDELRHYGTESYEREIERVRLAILKLSNGALEELRNMTAAAKRDYRDVLMWAEYPEESRALWAVGSKLTDEQRRELSKIRARDRAALEAWRKK
ncbi:MAG TPA: hypothetical protein VF103_12065 [Polyangiaceae bacterium]